MFLNIVTLSACILLFFVSIISPRTLRSQVEWDTVDQSDVEPSYLSEYDLSYLDEDRTEIEYQSEVSDSVQGILRSESTKSRKIDSKLSYEFTKHYTATNGVDKLAKSSHNEKGIQDILKQSSIQIQDSELELRRLPQAIIIGVKKCGTRALLQFLRTHPHVRSPGPEVHFFDKYYHYGLDWYRKQMPPTLAGQVTVEKTPSYWITKSVPERVYSMSKNTRLIVVVRDPTTRALSDYTQASTKRPDIGTFEKMAFVDNITGVVDTSWGAIRIGLYALHYANWISFFPRDRIHFVSGERLISEPAAELAKVQDFLGLERLITDKHFYFNSTKGFPCLVKSEGSASPRCLGKTKGRAHPVVDPLVLRRLRKFYQPFNEKFYRMTGIDFGWPNS